MPEMCYVCNEPTDIIFVRRIKEEGNDCAVYQCVKCKSITIKGSVNEEAMRRMMVKRDMPWHFNEDKGEFLCEYENRHIVKPIDRNWRCEECWRKCVYNVHLSNATISFIKKRI